MLILPGYFLTLFEDLVLSKVLIKKNKTGVGLNLVLIPY